MIQDLFPPSTRVNRIVPKRTFIDKLGANARMKEHFTRDVVSIEWFAKLAPSARNMDSQYFAPTSIWYLIGAELRSFASLAMPMSCLMLYHLPRKRAA